MSEEYATVKISKKLYELVRNRVNESRGEFKSVDEYIALIVTEVLKNEREQQQPDAYTPEQEAEIGKRLKRLGYL